MQRASADPAQGTHPAQRPKSDRTACRVTLDLIQMEHQFRGCHKSRLIRFFPSSFENEIAPSDVRRAIYCGQFPLIYQISFCRNGTFFVQWFPVFWSRSRLALTSRQLTTTLTKIGCRGIIGRVPPPLGRAPSWGIELCREFNMENDESIK